MRKSVAFWMICIIFIQCISFFGCTSKAVIEDDVPLTIDQESIAKETEIATEFVVIEGDFLEQYTVSQTIPTESTEKIVEETTVPDRDSYTEYYPFSEPTEVITEEDTSSFIPGENETPGDPL